MAKDLLVTETLTDAMTEAGADLITQLDQAESQIQSAFWLLYPDEKIWRLILASPLVSLLGPRNFYQRVLNANKQTDKENIISLHDITASTLSNKTVQLINLAIQTKETDISKIRFLKNAINGTFIEDSLIYRSSL